MSGGFTVRSATEVLRGPVVSVEDLVVVAPDGGLHERQVVRHPGAVSVVPLTDRDTIVLIRQYRVALDAFLLEIPAGKRDVAGEPPQDTARRELVEEVGLDAESLVPLAEFHNSPGFCDEHSIVFLATGLTPVAVERQGVEEEHLEVTEVGIDDLPALIADGSILDAKSLIGILLTLRHLGR